MSDTKTLDREGPYRPGMLELPRGAAPMFLASMVRSAVVGLVARYLPDVLAIDGVRPLIELGCIVLASFIAAWISTRSRAKGEAAAAADVADMLHEVVLTQSGEAVAAGHAGGGPPTLTGTRVGPSEDGKA